jgi:multidrug efflux pump subunit AcrA (membrane-fusion protein)
MIRAIHVQDGQSVKVGDALIELDQTINEAERLRPKSISRVRGGTRRFTRLHRTKQAAGRT